MGPRSVDRRRAGGRGRGARPFVADHRTPEPRSVPPWPVSRASAAPWRVWVCHPWSTVGGPRQATPADATTKALQLLVATTNLARGGAPLPRRQGWRTLLSGRSWVGPFPSLPPRCEARWHRTNGPGDRSASATTPSDPRCKGSLQPWVASLMVPEPALPGTDPPSRGVEGGPTGAFPHRPSPPPVGDHVPLSFASSPSIRSARSLIPPWVWMSSRSRISPVAS
jgi:hypothetical protein